MKKTINLVLSLIIFVLILTFPVYGETIDLQTISAGHEHTMAIKEDGSLWAWGSNRLGVFGDGTNVDSFLPKKIMEDVIAVSAGMGHSMAIKRDGSLWTWGNNSIGDETSENKSYPKKIMDDVVKISVGQGNVAAIKKDGSLWVWGYVSIGDGTGSSSNVPVKVMDDVVDVSISFSHTMAIKKDRSLWAWGDTALGNGTAEGSKAPIKIMDNVIDVSAGVGYSMAVTANGDLWVWGGNSFGELGAGNEEESLLFPTKIMNGVVKVSTTKMYLGRMGTESFFTMALKADGSLWTWGLNGAGQLGNGEIGYVNSVPTKIMDNVVDISTGFAHSMATKSDGSLWVWGLNNQGQTGDGTQTYNPKEYNLVPKKIMDGIMLDPSIAPVTYTYNQSILNIYDFYLYEGSHAGLRYEITNNTKPKVGQITKDISYYAMVLFSDDNSINPEIVFLRSAELEYNQSVYGNFPTRFGSQNVLEGKVNIIKLNFKDELERDNFKNSVPKVEIVRDHLETCMIIDNKEFGQKWFKENFNINLGGK